MNRIVVRRWVGNMGAATVVVIADYLLVLTDCVIAGRVLGEKALGAMNLLMPVFSLVMFALWLVVSGATAVYSKALAKGFRDRAARMAGTGLVASALTGLLVVLVLAVIKLPYLSFMSAGAEFDALSCAYWSWYPVATLLASLELMLFYLVYANGSGTTCVVAYGVQTIANIVASYALCLKTGMSGLSFGSVLAYLLGIGVLLPRICARSCRIPITFAFDFGALVRSFRTSFDDAFVWLFHAILFLVITKYVLVAWDSESLAVIAVVFCILRLTAFFGGIGFVLRMVKTEKGFLHIASALSFLVLALSTAIFFIAPELLAGLFGIEDLELAEGARMAARLTVIGICVSVLFAFIPLLWRARRASLPQATPNYLQQYILKRMDEEPDSQMFNLVKLFRLRKGVDLERLSAALVESARTHAALLTVLRRDVDGEIVQRQELPVSAIACPVVSADEKTLLANKATLVTNFGLFGKKLFNACIYDCGDAAYLLSDFHHLVCDGYSFPLILNGARKIYAGETLPNDAYYGVLAKREEKSSLPVAVAARALMRELLSDAKFVTLPPDDFESEGGIGFFEEQIDLPANFSDFLQARRVTRHHVFLSATVLALARQTQAKDILIDWVFHGRVSKDELQTVGAFMVDLPLTIEDLQQLTPLDVLSRVKMATFNGIKRVSSIRSVEDVNPDGRERLTFNYQDEWGELTSSGPVREEGPYGWMIEETFSIVPPAARPENPFNVEIMEHRDSTRLVIEYDSGRYSEGSVIRYANLFKAAFDGLVRSHDSTSF